MTLCRHRGRTAGIWVRNALGRLGQERAVGQVAKGCQGEMARTHHGLPRL